MTDRLDAFDLGVTTTPLRGRPAVSSSVIRPHPSPAMERALQRIETEIPVRVRALRARPYPGHEDRTK